LRIDDKNYQKDKNLDLIDLSDIPKAPVDLTLKQGRPRAICNEFLLYLLILRGCYGSITTKEIIEVIKDSRTIEHIMDYYNCKSLANNTIRENLNMITQQTIDFIIQCQLQLISDENLDDFKTVLMDSTAVAGNTSYPTDITTLNKLLVRIDKNFQNLTRFGIGFLEDNRSKEYLDIISPLVTSISLSFGNQNKKTKRKRKKNGTKLFKKSRKLINHYSEKQIELQEAWENIDLPPSKTMALDSLWYQIDHDLDMVEHVLKYAALFLIGYKPQIARSGNGFICAHITPCGNVSDSSMFTPLLDKVIKNTKIIPDLVSVDDGYTSKENLDAALKRGVQTVSFSGSKGKRITEDFWDAPANKYARNKRSAVESGMFTLKFNHNFGRLARRGIEAVNQEQSEKILAYNFMQILRVREKIKKYKLVS